MEGERGRADPSAPQLGRPHQRHRRVQVFSLRRTTLSEPLHSRASGFVQSARRWPVPIIHTTIICLAGDRSGIQGNGCRPFFRARAAALSWFAGSARTRKIRQVWSLRRFTSATARSQIHALLRSSELLHISYESQRRRASPGCRVRCSGSHSCPRTRDRKTYRHRRHTSASDARSTFLPMNFRHGSKA
jgi:hypothetical protein